MLSNKIIAIEIFSDDSIRCLLHSIPIKELFGDKDLGYRKLKIEGNELLDKYQISHLPALLFICQGELVGKIEGFYNQDESAKLREQIDKLLDQINPGR